MSVLIALLQRWTWTMAWRDSQSTRGRLFLFSLSISLGVAALVAIDSLGESVRRAIGQQAKTLLGADLVVTSRSPVTPQDEEWLATLGGSLARETSFSTMLSTTNGNRLVNARALDGGFPFYGQLETEPATAASAFHQGKGVLVEESLLQQFGVKPGDSVRLGKADFPVLGALRKVPGDGVAFGALAPRVLFPAADLDRTGLLKGVSLARYRRYFQLDSKVDAEKWVKENETELRKRRLETDTVARRQRDLGRAMENLFRFLNLVALVALLLGAIGVASAVQVHLRRKLASIAVLRCLGASISATFAIYLAQALALGTAGSLVGIVFGLAASLGLPSLLQGVLPVSIQTHWEWTSAAIGGAVGVGICLIFTLLPLLELRRVSPLAAIRAAFEPPRRRSAASWVVYAMMALAVAGFSGAQTPHWWEGFAFTGGLAVALGLLAGTAALIVQLAQQLTRLPLAFVVRQGLASLHRPNNRTLLLLVSLGLGTFLIVTLQLTRTVLLEQLFPPGQKNGPNALLFDIQTDQRDGLQTLFQRLGLPILSEAPVVTMRLLKVKEVPTETLVRKEGDPHERGDRPPDWALRREYRSTWRTNLIEAEHLIAGSLSPAFVGEPSASNRVPVSVEATIARELRVGVGDTLEFDIQGVPVPCTITSLRDVDWRQLRPNFYVVFPAGVLESAPAMFLTATHLPDSETSARLQRELGKGFPNVSTIDLATVLQTLEGILNKVALAIRFMAGLTVGTGVVVLIGAILSGRGQRVQEAVLLRTLGASRFQIRKILFTEYAVLGLFSALTGIVLSVAASWALARFTFQVDYAWSPGILLTALVAVPMVTITVGILTSRGVAEEPPLEILRQEGTG